MDNLSSANHILLLTSDRIGDVICYTLAIKMLREAKPTIKLDVMVFSDQAANVLQNNPDIDHVYVNCSKKQFKQMAPSYDAVIAIRHSRTNKEYASWYTPTIMCPRPEDSLHLNLHAVVFLKKLFELPTMPLADKYPLYPQNADFSYAKSLLIEQGVGLTDSELLIGCHMGCRHIAKRGLSFWRRKIVADNTKSWPFENFVQLIKDYAQDNPRIKFILTGVPSENKLATYYMKGLPNVVNVIGKTSVLELAAIMKYFKVYLTGDTGPLHVASSTDVPIVALFGRTKAEAFGPYPLRKDRIILSEGFDLKSISIAAVKQALNQLLPV